MEYDALTVGITPDGLKNRTDIKILICYLVCGCNGELNRSELLQIIFSSGIANYFEACDAIDTLLSNGSITMDDESKTLSATELSREASETFSRQLPMTVRERSLSAAKKYIARRRSEKENKVAIEDIENGCRITCAVMEGETELMSLSMILPDRSYAERVRERFLESPEFIYRLVLSHMTGEQSLAPEGNSPA